MFGKFSIEVQACVDQHTATWFYLDESDAGVSLRFGSVKFR